MRLSNGRLIPCKIRIDYENHFVNIYLYPNKSIKLLFTLYFRGVQNLY